MQVNSQYPGDPSTQKDNKIPGSIQQTTSGDRTAIAETGFSPDGAVLGPDADEGSGGSAPANPLTGLTEQTQGPAHRRPRGQGGRRPGQPAGPARRRRRLRLGVEDGRQQGPGHRGVPLTAR
ncbi:hypothetical protein G5V59_08875 [Nocardioides sp. W3-2-3]|uniref:hypothetical protein n=1 Tax=Nocardioides convexus TaxID=2712224 RepID=UPI00241835C8|nr:hypothetical protein [Nocardioides convexus]NHA00201.1 hypothetical protein [Nocardioides convexus]